jgi:hypothetical protein
MVIDVKYTHKASYRINDRIKSIINRTIRDVRKETGMKLSLGKLSRAFWVSLADDPSLRRKFIDSACKTMLEDIAERYGKCYDVSQRKKTNRYGNITKRRSLRQRQSLP